MKIYVKARSFFEACRGTGREREFFRDNRIISINSVSHPAEMPPFSEEFLNADNLLILYFDDDVDAGSPNAMTSEQAKQIVDFIHLEDNRPIIVHCTAGISRSGAVGEVLNWYFNRFVLNDSDYSKFATMHQYIIPNAHVRRLLLAELRRNN